MPLSPRLHAAVALLLIASPIWAECPTVAHLADGIVLAQNDPFFIRSDFKSAPGGFSEVRVTETNGEVRQSIMIYRHGLVMVGEHSAAGRLEITYIDRLTPLADLPERGSVVLNGIAKGPSGEAYVELDVAFVAHGRRELAGCGYVTWVVNSTLRERGGAGAVYRMEYAPELDLVLASSLVGEDGSATPVYAYQWAGTAAEVAR